MSCCEMAKEIQMSWYYCLVHQAVEPDRGCANAERMGPYETEEEATDSMDMARQRNEEYDSQEDD